MSKTTITVSLSDMYALKHALEQRLSNRYKQLAEKESKTTGDMPIEEWIDFVESIHKLRNDIRQEEGLLKRVEEKITNYKEKYRIGR